MTYKNATTTIIFTILATSLVVFASTEVYAEESKYKIADDVSATLTFHFKDGIEVIDFPIYEMNSNYVENVRAEFSVEGVVSETPLLHKALDESWIYRSDFTPVDFDYKQFDVDVDIHKSGQHIKLVHYSDCEIADASVETLNDDQESYLSSKSGFVVVDVIDFECSQVKIQNNEQEISSELLPFDFGHDIRTFLNFDFKDGEERIEFPMVDLESGYDEGENASPNFKAIGLVTNYPLLDAEVEKSKKFADVLYGFDDDFDVVLEFDQNGTIIRSIDFIECQVDEYIIETLRDKEEGFTGKRGFALVEDYLFQCAGMNPHNPLYENVNQNHVGSSLSDGTMATEQYNFGFGPTAVATFTFDNDIEVIDFALFEQLGDVYSRDNPSFELVGIPGNYPILYDYVDHSLGIGPNTSGISAHTKLFDVDVDLMYGDKAVRGFNYSDCRVILHFFETERDKEDGFFKGFVHENTFEFECRGYHPNNPVYDSMFEVEKANNIKSSDLRNTQTWSSGFK